MTHKFEDAIKIQMDEKKKLRDIAFRITKIPKKFLTDGKLDLDKVHLSLMDYQK